MTAGRAVVGERVVAVQRIPADARDRGAHTLTVRDEVFLFAHDEDRRFKLLVNPRSLAVALAGATLADLLIAGVATVDHTRVFVRSFAQPPTDRLLAEAMGRLRVHGGTLSLPTALGLIAPGLYERTQAYLVVAGRLRPVHRRLLGPRHTLADGGLNVRVRARARDAVDGQDIVKGLAPDPVTDGLCVLVHALGLHDRMFFFNQAVPEVRAAVADAIDRLPTRYAGGPLAGLPIIGTVTKAAIGDAATAVYT
ncbi:hypothetical protein GCM10010124_31290 [Pilimelia terevasa]|uniref:Uncharacterized protein n=1 Tax=Pilimelia terevasa TaxID=53372 RepID=A0A8J3BPG1_9ACTN|nr:GPP34 family phosphoprotein [Pilimelia terevasa]GGK36388.1 hypothetical protein GCM10010124_31290 [Pilimelia terevasa]